jgi:hypothetical protein
MKVKYVSIEETKDFSDLMVRIEELSVFLKLRQTIADFCKNIYNFVKRL